MQGFRNKKAVLAVLLLIFAASYASASGKKVWSINVAKLGYRGDATWTIVRWRGNYVVIGSVKFTLDPEKSQCIVSFDPKQPLLIFDVNARKQVTADVLGSLKQEWEPPQAHKNVYPCASKTRYLPVGMAINGDLSYGHDYDRNQFLVLDSTRKVKNRISPDAFGCWSTCVISSRSGNRFAILEKGQSLAARIINATENLLHDEETDKKKVRVYSGSDGKKLFALSWFEPDHFRSLIDESERVAFSDDGEMLAVLDDEGTLRIFRISDR